MGWEGVIWYGGGVEVYYAFLFRVGGISDVIDSSLVGRVRGSISATLTPNNIDDFSTAQSGDAVTTINTPLALTATSGPDLFSGAAQQFAVYEPAVELSYTITIEVIEQGILINDEPRELNAATEILIQQFNAETFEVIGQEFAEVSISTLSTVGTTVSESAVLTLP